MREYELWVNMNYWWGGQTNTRTHTQTHRHINTMTGPGLGAWPSESHANGANIGLTPQILIKTAIWG